MQNKGVPVDSGFVTAGLYIWNTTQNEQAKLP